MFSEFGALVEKNMADCIAGLDAILLAMQIEFEQGNLAKTDCKIVPRLSFSIIANQGLILDHVMRVDFPSTASVEFGILKYK